MNSSIMSVNSVCDVSTIFAGGGPSPTAGAFVSIGGKQLIPSPFISLTLEKYKVGELTIGGVHKLSINGSVVGSSFGEVVTTGANSVTGLQDILKIGQYKECVKVEIKCGNSKIVDGFGRVTSINIPQGNNPTWVNRAEYTIDIDLYTNDIGLSGIRPANPGYIINGIDTISTLMLKSISEAFTININDESFNWMGSGCPSTPGGIDSLINMGDRHIRVNFNISAAGIRKLECEASGSPATENSMTYGLLAAESYIRSRINELRLMNISNLFSSPPTGEIVPSLTLYSGGKSYSDFRSLEVNPLEDSLSVNGELIYRPSGCVFPQALTSISVEENVDGEGAVFTISGNIKGLVDTNYDKIIKLSPDKFQDCQLSTKIENAESVLVGLQAKATGIANCYYTSSYINDTCPYSASYISCTGVYPSPSVSPNICDLRLVSRQISRNLTQGEVNFTYIVSNKANCNILGAKKVDVEVTHDMPHDNIVEILIPGRGSAGVITQNLCCKSIEKYDASINITLNNNNCNNSMPSGTLATLRSCAEEILKNKLDPNVVNCWFITNHQESDGNNTYKLNKTYVRPSC